MKDLLVVVDMVNGFVNVGALADKKINKITPTIVSLIKKAKEIGMDIVDFRDCHSNDDEEFKVFPPHCLKGSIESELIAELKPYAKDMIDIPKTTTNGFITKKFLEIVKANKYDRVFVVGCCTDICVKNFVDSYLNFNKKYNRNTKVVVFEDACYTFDGKDHNAENEHKKAISYLKHRGAYIATAKSCTCQSEK